MEDQYKTTDKFNRFAEGNKEVLNPTPHQPALNYKARPSLADQVRQQIATMRAMEDNEPETEEDADDFEIDDDPVMESRWENDMIPSIKESRARMRELEEQERLYANPEQPPVQKAPLSPDPTHSGAPEGSDRDAKGQ